MAAFSGALFATRLHSHYNSAMTEPKPPTTPIQGAMAHLTQRDLQQYLEQQGIQARLIPDLGHTPTVPAAAEVLGVEPDQIVKTLLFVLEAREDGGQIPPAVVVIGNGENRISKRALGQHFGLNPKRVKLAPAETVIDLLGYPPGGVPPFGHRTPLPVILDQKVMELQERYNDRVFGGGGDDYTMLELTVSDLLRVHQPEVLALAED
jgi:prolyl-tRNA editing enzyme YbaK/EbsC (Cys-tRNA(Pro) deacylase)